MQGVLAPKFAPGLNATVPAGVENVPALVAGSTTVAVHVAVCVTITVAREHEIVVVVGLRFTTTVVSALLLE